MERQSYSTRRWLLPFTHDLDLEAIETALWLSARSDATLVAASLVVAQSESRVRLERLQQSRDFLEAVSYQAQRLEAPFETHEAFTANPLETINGLTAELNCNGLILVSKGERPRLLETSETHPLLLHPPTSLVLIQLSAPRLQWPRISPRERLRAWWPSSNKVLAGSGGIQIQQQKVTG